MKAYIYYNSVVPSALWQRIKWIFTYDKMELLKWEVYGGKTELFTWMGLNFIFKFYFDRGPEQKLEDAAISS